MVPLVIDDPQERIDIDTEWDWKVAELLLKVHPKCSNEMGPKSPRGN
jgi:hypothetical protein